MNARSVLLPGATVAALLLTGRGVPSASSAPPRQTATLLSARRIWDRAPHNAFTDLIRHNDRWFCVFREGEAHVSNDGRLRVIHSTDGLTWRAGPVLLYPGADLRDAKITRTPSGELMLSGAGALHQPSPVRHRSLAWFSRDGFRWSDPTVIGDPDLWLWRTTWIGGTALSIGYGTAERRFVRLYAGSDGRKFETRVENLFDREYPNEHSLVEMPDGSVLCLLRRDEGSSTGLLGKSRPPFTAWTWSDLGIRIGGPAALRLPDGRIVAVVRLYQPRPRTSLCWLDPAAPRLTECLTLPSGGDTSYAGLVWHEDRLWVSYYSSHEGKTSIYLAQVAL